jgi:hypothetical protein
MQFAFGAIIKSLVLIGAANVAPAGLKLLFFRPFFGAHRRRLDMA